MICRISLFFFFFVLWSLIFDQSWTFFLCSYDFFVLLLYSILNKVRKLKKKKICLSLIKAVKTLCVLSRSLKYEHHLLHRESSLKHATVRSFKVNFDLQLEEFLCFFCCGQSLRRLTPVMAVWQLTQIQGPALISETAVISGPVFRQGKMTSAAAEKKRFIRFPNWLLLLSGILD